MDPLATPAQLATRLGTATQAEADAGSPDLLDTLRALDALSSASGAIRDAAGWPISRVIGDTYVADCWNNWTVWLPTAHLTDVSAVVGSTPLVLGTDFRFYESGRVTLANNSSYWTRYANFLSTDITFTFTHGYNPVPDGVVDLCLEIAAQKYVNPERWRQTDLGSIVTVKENEVNLRTDPRLSRYMRLAVA